MKLPTELELGSPGYGPSVEITEVNFGSDWKTPDHYHDLAYKEAQAEQRGKKE